MNNNISEDKIIICTCKGISKAEIRNSIKKGSKTLNDIKLSTGAGTGICSGAACTFKLLKVIDLILSEEIENLK